VTRAASSEHDPSLRRVQRDAALMTAAAAAAALVLQRGRVDGALGVVAGAGLMAFSYVAIKGGVTALVGRAAVSGSREGAVPRVAKGRLAWLAARFIGRYLVVGAAAWVVLVPLQAHPLGLFAGVTAPIAAIGVEAVRLALGQPGNAGRRAP
jgi:hypothetical protein